MQQLLSWLPTYVSVTAIWSKYNPSWSKYNLCQSRLIRCCSDTFFFGLFKQMPPNIETKRILKYTPKCKWLKLKGSVSWPSGVRYSSLILNNVWPKQPYIMTKDKQIAKPEVFNRGTYSTVYAEVYAAGWRPWIKKPMTN